MVCQGDYLKTVNLQTINDIPHLDDTKINNLLFADGLAIFHCQRRTCKKEYQY